MTLFTISKIGGDSNLVDVVSPTEQQQQHDVDCREYIPRGAESQRPRTTASGEEVSEQMKQIMSTCSTCHWSCGIKAVISLENKQIRRYA
jgi:hypothetical protein